MFLGLPDPNPLVRDTDGNGSFYHQAKIVRQILIATVFWLLYDFLSGNVPSKSNKQKNFSIHDIHSVHRYYCDCRSYCYYRKPAIFVVTVAMTATSAVIPKDLLFMFVQIMKLDIGLFVQSPPHIVWSKGEFRILRLVSSHSDVVNQQETGLAHP